MDSRFSFYRGGGQVPPAIFSVQIRHPVGDLAVAVPDDLAGLPILHDTGVRCAVAATPAAAEQLPTTNGCGWCCGHCTPNAIVMKNRKTGQIVWNGYGEIADWVTDEEGVPRRLQGGLHAPPL